MLYQPMNAFSHGSSVAQSARTQLARVFEVLDARPAIASRPNALRPERVAGRIELRDVSFRYDADRPVLGHVNLVIEPDKPSRWSAAPGGKIDAGQLALALLRPVAG